MCEVRGPWPWISFLSPRKLFQVLHPLGSSVPQGVLMHFPLQLGASPSALPPPHCPGLTIPAFVYSFFHAAQQFIRPLEMAPCFFFITLCAAPAVIPNFKLPSSKIDSMIVEAPLAHLHKHEHHHQCVLDANIEPLVFTAGSPTDL